MRKLLMRSWKLAKSNSKPPMVASKPVFALIFQQVSVFRMGFLKMIAVAMRMTNKARAATSQRRTFLTRGLIISQGRCLRAGLQGIRPDPPKRLPDRVREISASDPCRPCREDD